MTIYAPVAAGKIKIVGDDINTDYIVPSRRKKETINPVILRQFMFEDIYPNFFSSLIGDTILIGGRDFGCGSAMEVAVTVPIHAGVRAIVAKSFSRTYQRNAINNGLLVLKADTSKICVEDSANIFNVGGEITLRTDSGLKIKCEKMPSFMLDMISCGGLTEYLKQHGDFPEEQNGF